MTVYKMIVGHHLCNFVFTNKEDDLFQHHSSIKHVFMLTLSKLAMIVCQNNTSIE